MLKALWRPGLAWGDQDWLLGGGDVEEWVECSQVMDGGGLQYVLGWHMQRGKWGIRCVFSIAGGLKRGETGSGMKWGRSMLTMWMCLNFIFYLCGFHTLKKQNCIRILPWKRIVCESKYVQQIEGNVEESLNSRIVCEWFLAGPND